MVSSSVAFMYMCLLLPLILFSFPVVPPIDASIMCVPTSDGTNSIRSEPLADSCVTRADTLVLLGESTVATQSLPRIEAPGGGSTSKTAGRFAGTSRVDSPRAVSPGDDMMLIFQGEPAGKGEKKKKRGTGQLRCQNIVDKNKRIWKIKRQRYFKVVPRCIR